MPSLGEQRLWGPRCVHAGPCACGVPSPVIREGALGLCGGTGWLRSTWCTCDLWCLLLPLCPGSLCPSPSWGACGVGECPGVRGEGAEAGGVLGTLGGMKHAGRDSTAELALMERGWGTGNTGREGALQAKNPKPQLSSG